MTNFPEDCSKMPNKTIHFRDLSLNNLKSQPKRPNALTLRNRSESPAPLFSASRTAKSVNRDIVNDLRMISGEFKFNKKTIFASFEDFINEGPMGSGTCSVVFKVRHREKKDFIMAVKQMQQFSSSEEETKRILMDLDVIIKSHDCLHIVQCYGIIYSPEIVWIGMEIMATCIDKLIRRVGAIPEKAVAKIAVAITKALDYLKITHKIIHRDVKPSNMLLSQTGDIKLCDFGISGNLKDSIAQSHRNGCFGYMSPERFSRSSYDARADIWSLGISLLEMAIGKFPYADSKNAFEIISKIVTDEPPQLPQNNQEPFTQDFHEFVKKCLVKDYKTRAKYSELKNTSFYTTHDCLPYSIDFWMKGLDIDFSTLSVDDTETATPIVTTSTFSQSSDLPTPKFSQEVIPRHPRRLLTLAARNIQSKKISVGNNDDEACRDGEGSDNVKKRSLDFLNPTPAALGLVLRSQEQLANAGDAFISTSQPSSGYGSAGSDNSPGTNAMANCIDDSSKGLVNNQKVMKLLNEKFYNERIRPWESTQTPDQPRKASTTSDSPGLTGISHAFSKSSAAYNRLEDPHYRSASLDNCFSTMGTRASTEKPPVAFKSPSPVRLRNGKFYQSPFP